MLAAGTLLVLIATPATAQDDLACEAPPLSGIGDQPFFDIAGDDEFGPVVFEAGSIDATVGPDPRMTLAGGVLVRRGSRVAGAESAVYDPATTSLRLDGDVQFRDPSTQIISDSALFSYSTGIVAFDGAQFLLSPSGSRGAAGRIELSQQGVISLGAVNYTTCPVGSDDWLLEADDIVLDTNTGKGTAKNVALRFKGVPFLYAPRLTFPLGDARKTGFLVPEIGSTGRSGNELRVPFYWNIRENYDATITPRLLTERGLQVATEFRYLTERNDGTAVFEYLPDDDLFGDTRSYVQYNHRTLFDSGWRNRIDFSEASDSRYFEDLRAGLSATSITHLNRSALFDYYGDDWSFFGQVQDYQTIDEAIVPEDQPYRRAPQLRFAGFLPQQPYGFRAGVDSELVSFDRDVGVTGWRFDVQPQVDWSLQRPGWFVQPSVILQHTNYNLEDTAPGQRTDPSRTLPIYSMDMGMHFERRMQSNSDWFQTLEPRLQYVHIPFDNQDDLPIFDTIEPDLNLVQLFRKNRFVGVDRVADTDQISFGVTTRIISGEDGNELLTATVGQARYLSEQGVSLPGMAPIADRESDYIVETRFRLAENFNFDFGHQWGAGQRGTQRSEARLQYRPATNKIMNFAYRFRRGLLEQGDVSWSWPLAQNWNFVGRYNYSFRDEELLEEFYGLEYESCCWGIRLVGRRYVSTREGTLDSSVGLQLVLKGMASVGTGADRILERGILGYSSTLD